MKSRFFALAVLLSAASPVALVGCASDESVEGADDDLTSDAKARIATFTGEGTQPYYFHFKAGNGEVMLSSEGYSSAQARQTGIDSVKLNGSKSANYEIREARSGQYYFVLKSPGNNKVIGCGETYSSKSNAQKAITRLARLFTNIKISEAPRVARFEVFKSLNDKQYYFQLRAGNGEIVLQSEGYTTKANAVKGAKAVISAPVGSVSTTVSGTEFYFTVKAANGEVVGVSETYTTKAAAQNAAQRVWDVATLPALPQAVVDAE